MRSTLLAGVLLGSLSALVAAAPARGQEAPAPAAQPERLAWVEGWEAGRATAREQGRLMLVYVHRIRPH